MKHDPALKPDPVDALIARYAKHAEFRSVRIGSVFQKGKWDNSLLHLAVLADSSEDVALLLVCGADPNAVGDLGNTPLHFAALSGSANIATKLLDSGARLFDKNEFGETPGDVALTVGNLEFYDAIATGALKEALRVRPPQPRTNYPRSRWLAFRELYDMSLIEAGLKADDEGARTARAGLSRQSVGS